MGVVLRRVCWGSCGFGSCTLLLGSREGSPHAAREQLITSVSHQAPLSAEGMINERLFMCGSDSPVAPGQADIY